MPTGHPIEKQVRDIIYHHYVYLRYSPSDIFYLLFHGNNNIVTLKHIQRLCRMFDTNLEATDAYLNGPAPNENKGRPRIMDEHRTNHVLRVDNPQATLRACATTHAVEYYANPHDAPSVDTVRRSIVRSKWSRKVIERVPIGRSPQERIEYLEFIAFVHPSRIIDIDETASSADQLINKRGWSPVGKKCRKVTIAIGNVTYTVIAAYTLRGFLAWEIYRGSVTQHEFQHFLRLRLSPYILHNSVGIMDNASIHRTVGSVTAINDVFHGNFKFAPRYSFDLKPIEKGFSNVKRWIRLHEDMAIREPLRWIDAAFHRYSVLGRRSKSALGHWRKYFANHRYFLEDHEAV